MDAVDVIYGLEIIAVIVLVPLFIACAVKMAKEDLENLNRED